MKLGDISLAHTLAHEHHLFVSLGGGLVGSNGTATWLLPQYTMPMAGSLTASLDVAYQFTNGIQDVYGLLSESTPAVGTTFGFTRSGNALDGRTTYTYGKLLAIWPLLAAGTIVSVRLTVNVAGLPPTVQWNFVDGFLRATCS